MPPDPKLWLSWLQIVALLAVWTVGIAGVFWKLKGGPLERKVGELVNGEPGNPKRRAVRVDELDRVGEKINEQGAAAERRETRVTALEGTVRDQGKDMGHIREGLGRVTTWMETCSRDTHDMKVEIIGFISQRTDQLSKQVQDVEVQLAVVKDRVETMRSARESGAFRAAGEER